VRQFVHGASDVISGESDTGRLTALHSLIKRLFMAADQDGIEGGQIVSVQQISERAQLHFS